MDVKVYKKEEVLQPSGTEYIYKPDIIDLIPEIIESETDSSYSNGTWSLAQLKRVADVTVEGNKLIINSPNVTYADGNLYVHVTEEQIVRVETLADGSHDLLEQQCALATIFQRGLDPIDPDDGIRWSEAMLGEVSVVELMADISEAVAKVSTSVTVEFDTVTDSEGKEYLTYTLKEVA